MTVPQAIDVLKKSGRGFQVLRDLITILDQGAISLDQQGQEAMLTVLAGAWERPMSVRDAMRDSVNAWR